MRCPKCDSEIPAGERFCEVCGTEVVPEEAAPQEEPGYAEQPMGTSQDAGTSYQDTEQVASQGVDASYQGTAEQAHIPENGETVVLTPEMLAGGSYWAQGQPEAPQWQAPQGQPEAPQGQPNAAQGQPEAAQWQAPQGQPEAPQGQPNAAQGQPEAPQWQAPQGAPQGQPEAPQWQAPQGAPQGQPNAQQGQPQGTPQWQMPQGAPQGQPNAAQGQQGASQWQMPNGAPQGPQQGMGYQAPPKQKKPLNTKLIAIIAAAAVVAIVVIAVAVTLISNRKQTISLEDYITVTGSGYDGYGTVYVDFDWDTYSDDLLEKSKVKVSRSSDGSYDSSFYLSDDYTSFYTVYMGTSYEADTTSGLSNGDKVTITFTYDEETAKKIGIKYKSSSMEYEVTGLDEVVEVDPFADITVEFSGTSPDAYASVVNNSTDEVISDLYFEIDKNSGIALGDTVTVSVYTYSDDEDYYAEYYGYKFTQLSKEYVCENVDCYAASADDVDEDILGQMKSQAEDVIEAYFATESGSISYSGLTYMGFYFLSNKGTTYDSENKIYLVYSVTVSSNDDSFAVSTVYMPIMYSNLIIYADGTSYVDLSNYSGILGDTSLEYGWWDEVSGYDSLALLKNDLVTSQKADYTDSYSGDLE